MNWLDRAICWFSPERGLYRLLARDACRSYDAGNTGDRLNRGWVATNATAEQTDAPHRDLLRARARDLERNSDVMGSILGAYERHVIGPKIRLQMKICRQSSTEIDEPLCALVEKSFKRWSKPRYCDLTGQQSLAELCRMAERRLKVDGGMLFLKSYTGSGPVPFQLQAREVDDLDTTLFTQAPNGNMVFSGIELDTYNRPVAYWLKTTTPDGFWTGQSQRIEASQVIFPWKKTRPSQIREICQLASTLSSIRDMQEYMEAVSVKERIAACFAMFIERQHPSTVGRDGTKDARTNYANRKMTPGMMVEGNPGEKAYGIMPPNSAGNAKDFLTLQQRIAAAGQGLSYEITSRDMSQTNYSSARFARGEDQAEFDLDFTFMVDHLLDEIVETFIISGVLAKTFPMPNFWQEKDRYLDHEILPTGMPWGDPLKEANGNRVAMETGQDTLENICAERGLHWKEVLDQRAREVEYARAKGLDLSGHKGNTNATQPTADTSAA